MCYLQIDYIPVGSAVSFINEIPLNVESLDNKTEVMKKSTRIVARKKRKRVS